MPVYDYVCGTCGHRFSRRFSRSVVPLAALLPTFPHICPNCNTLDAFRQFPLVAPAVIK